MIRLLPQAIARDPNFILAYCLLAKAYDGIYQEKNFDWQADRDQAAALAQASIDQALHLRPDRGEPHLALAYHDFTMARYAAARPELDRALSLLPNDANAIFLAARLDRHENRWDDALREARRACELDPHRKFFVVWTAETYAWMRRYKDGEEFVRKAQNWNWARATSLRRWRPVISPRGSSTLTPMRKRVTTRATLSMHFRRLRQLSRNRMITTSAF